MTINELKYREILSGAMIGMEFEFYSEYNRNQISKLLGPWIKKKIEVDNKYHGGIDISGNVFKIEPDYSGGKKMHELVTGPMPFDEAKVVMIRIFDWINKNGWTDERSAFHINISFDKNKIKLSNRIEFLNRLKFILGFNEDFIYERYPNRKNNVYTKTVKFIIPINKFIFNVGVDYPDPNQYQLPNSKYYGVNFEKLSKGYLEFRYMGGRGYEKKVKENLEILNYLIIYLHDVLENNNIYSQIERDELRKILKDQKKIVTSFSDLDNLFLNYPNIKLFVDLKSDREVIKAYYTKIREKLFDFIVRGGVTQGKINYDSDVGKFQIKDSVIENAFELEGWEIFHSIVIGNIEKCDLYNCDIKNSFFADCNLYYGNKISKSRIINSPVYYNNEIYDSYIDNRLHFIDCKVDGGIIRSGEVGKNSIISPETEIIQGPVIFLGSIESKKGKKGKKGKGEKDFDIENNVWGIKTLSGKQGKSQTIGTSAIPK